MERLTFSRWTVLRLLVGFLTVTGLVLTLVIASRELPFHVRWTASGGVIEPLRGVPLPAGLRAGDRLSLIQQSVRTREALKRNNVSGIGVYILKVQRDGHTFPVSVRSVVRPTTVSGVQRLLYWIEQIMLVALGLLTLWSGRNLAAWGLAIFALSITLGNILQVLPVPAAWSLVSMSVAMWLYGPMSFLGLYLTAVALVERRPRLGHGLGLLYLLTALALFANELGGVLAFVVAGVPHELMVLQDLDVVFALIGLGVPLGILLRGYTQAAADSRLRIRWIFTATGLLLPLTLINSLVLPDRLIQHSALSVEWWRGVSGVLTVATLGLYTYAVLRQRLVEVRVVVNRALVFAVLMGSLVGFFTLMESLIERSAIGASAGLALELGVPLVLGVLFHQLHRRIERLVDRVFFYREHRARAALEDFVHDAGFIESPQTLIARAVEAFGRNAGVVGVALYEARDEGFVCSGRDRAGAVFPDRLDQDDRALVRLRANLAPLDLHGLDSALGGDGLALPLALRGRLFGVLVCGPRPAGRHAQADVARLGRAAHEVGASLFSLRARVYERLVEGLARGVLSPAQAVRQARELASVDVS